MADPLVEGCDVGALISENHLHKVLSYIGLAKEEGGRILTGGRQVHLEGRCEGGYFVEPTIIGGLSPYCRVNQEEIFGPVATLTPFDGEDEAVEYANSHAVPAFPPRSGAKTSSAVIVWRASSIRRDLDQLLAASGSSDTFRRHEAIWGRPRGRL